MLGLIYPAVLGTILYRLLEVAAHIITREFPLNKILFIKVVLLLISTAFYVCDYLYLYFSTRYYSWFFMCDIIFLITLYSTVVAIDVDNPSSLPHNKIILLFYLVFLLVYLLWDLHEFRILPPGSERGYFLRVVIWEGASVLLIATFLIVCFLWSNHFAISVLTLGLLLLVTVSFGCLVAKKRVIFLGPS